ncbi:hypothetical protein FKP32DRAFT_1562285, partial [Trametes sanguinea]
ILEGGQSIQGFSNLPADQDSFTWQTNVRAGTQVSLWLSDAAGDVAQSAPFVIKDGRKSLSPFASQILSVAKSLRYICAVWQRTPATW